MYIIESVTIDQPAFSVDYLLNLISQRVQFTSKLATYLM